MNSSNTNYKIAIAVLAIFVLISTPIAVMFFKHSKDLNASLVIANERIVADSLLIKNSKSEDDEIFKFLSAYDSTWVFLSAKEDLLPFLDTLLKSYANKNNAFQSQLANKESQINGLKNEIIGFESQLDSYEFQKNYYESQKYSYESKLFTLETDLMRKTRLLDSVSVELAETEFELSLTAVDSLIIYAPNGNKIYYYGKIFNQSPKDFGIGFYEGKGYYIGEWKGNQRDGWGRHIYKDDSVYEGYFERDLRSGFGTYYYDSGDIYTGNWKDDLMEGKGKVIQTDGKSMKGIWKGGKFLMSD